MGVNNIKFLWIYGGSIMNQFTNLHKKYNKIINKLMLFEAKMGVN